jgi:4-amino-4-deoxy-L-arabinose transferase-like glycosyltransferase
VHPTLVYAATHIQVAMLAATLVAVVMALAYRSARQGNLIGAAATGVALGLLVLTDPILGLAAVGVGLVWLFERGWMQAARGVAVVGVVSVLMVTPWIARNYRAHGELVLIKSTFGYAFWQGNCFGSEGTDKVVRSSVEKVLARRESGGLKDWNLALWEARHEAGYIDDILLTKQDYVLLGSMTEPERSRHLFRRAMDDLRTEPVRYLALTARRLRYFFLFDETNPKTRALVYRLGHVGLTVLALFGWFVMGPDTRRMLRPTAAVVLLIAAFHAATIVSARFHIPIEPLMAVWAGMGLAGVAEWVASLVQAKTARRDGPSGTVPALAVMLGRWG